MPWKLIEKTCPICGKKFIAQSVRKFCSIQCVGKYNSFRSRYKNEPTCEKLKHLYFKENKSLAWLIKYFEIPRTSMKRRLKRCNIDSKYSIPSHFINNKMPAIKKNRIKRTYFFVYAPDNQRAHKDGYVQEHVIIWEKHHKKSLPKNWVIHHLNNIKTDNRIGNLKAMPKGKHHSWLYIQSLQQRIRQLEMELSTFLPYKEPQ